MYTLIFILILVLIIIIMVTVLYNRLKRSPEAYIVSQALNALKENQKEEAEKEKFRKEEINRIQEVCKYDMNFSKDYLEDLIKKALPLTLQLSDSNAVNKLKRYVTSSFLNNFIEDLQTMTNTQKRANNNISVKDIYITDFKPINDALFLYVNALVEYDRTYYNQHGAITKLKHVKNVYNVELRKKEEITGYNDAAPITNCPNCGSPIDVTLNTHCEYCNTEIYKKVNIWLINQVSNTQETSI